MNKLLNKPFKAYTLFSLLILLISIPVYVLVVDQIWLRELDENNWLALEHLKKNINSRDYTDDDIANINEIWGELQPGFSIAKIKGPSLPQDSIYEVQRNNAFDGEDESDRFRGLRSSLILQGQAYQITIETNVEEADETLLAIALVTLLFFFVLIIGFILINRRLARKTWQPFYKTLVSLRNFDLSKDEALILDKSNIAEFQELNESLEQLVARNIKVYQQQKAFTENASHELQTPIALLKSKLDLLLQEKDLNPSLSTALNAIEAPLARLSRINKNLLLLAKVENQQYATKEEINLQAYLHSALSLFEDYINDKTLKVKLNLQENITLQAHSFLVETLVHNFLSNAIRHSVLGGELEIELSANTLWIRNSGKTSLDTKNLFERFASSSTEKVSSGLGLAIIKEVANTYHWQLNYQFSANQHVFTLCFD